MGWELDGMGWDEMEWIGVFFLKKEKVRQEE